MPGAGQYYMLPMVPALAVLTAYSVSVVRKLKNGKHYLLLIGLLLAMQFSLRKPVLLLPGRKAAPFAVTGAYIKENSPEVSRVISTSYQTDFYVDKPVGVIKWMKREKLLELLGGEKGPYASHVVLRSLDMKKKPAWYNQETWTLLQKNYLIVEMENTQDVDLFESKKNREQKQVGGRD